MQIKNLTWDDIDRLTDDLAARLPRGSRCWGVPRGGSVVAALLRSRHNTSITAHWSDATIAVDDLIDSGRTARWVRENCRLDLEPLIIKQNADWIVFPWEGSELAEDAENTVTRMLQQIGENPNRPQLQDTPRRVVQVWDALFSGYRQNAAAALLPETRIPPAAALLPETRIPPAAAADNGLVAMPGLPYISACEKHLLPFHGTAHISYLTGPTAPNGNLPVDLPQLVNLLSRRLQRPQRLARQICAALTPHTRAAAVRLDANLICRMTLKGEAQPSAVTKHAFSGELSAPALQAQFKAALPAPQPPCAD